MKASDFRKIVREGIDPDPLYGIVLRESDNLTLVARELDFVFDGYQVVRKADVTASTSTAGNKYGFKLLKAEGALSSIAVPDVDLGSWRDLFSSLGTGRFVWLENETTGDFTVGPIVRVNPKSVRVHYFDAAGKWQDGQTFKYEDITTVQFGTRYLNLHAKYITTPNR